MYKLSPSDFAYLYEECKLCYYLKIRLGISRPSSPFPGVFSAINTRLQGNLVGKNLQELSTSLPDGIAVSQEEYLKSTVIPNTNVYISGKYDLLVQLPDKTYMVIDLKLSTPTGEKVAKYQSQLWSYVYALEHPAEGEAKSITRAGLLIFYPDKVEFSNNNASLTFPPVWLEAPIKRDEFITLIQNLSNLLEGPPPKYNPECKWCNYREENKILSSDQGKLPF